MGCWNETCLFSRLPITCGQEIACVFIAPVEAHPGTVYPDSQFVPVSLPFYGRYDDYGRIEDFEDAPAALKSLENTAFWKKDQDRSWERVPTPGFGDADWRWKLTDLSDDARQDFLWVRNKRFASGYAQVRLAFVHKDLWDFAVKSKLGGMTLDYLDTLAHKWPAAKGVSKKDKPAVELLRQLAAADAAMSAMRVAWQPTCGTGHQNCIDHRWQDKMYKMFADRAHAFYQSAQY